MVVIWHIVVFLLALYSIPHLYIFPASFAIMFIILWVQELIQAKTRRRLTMNKKTDRDFKETVKDRANRDPEFRNEILKEALEAIDCGDIDVAKALLRNCIWNN